MQQGKWAHRLNSAQAMPAVVYYALYLVELNLID